MNEEEKIVYVPGIAGVVVTVEMAKKIMLLLTDAERLEVIQSFCEYCGSTDKNCQCWNDD